MPKKEEFIGLYDFFKKFPNERSVILFYETQRWITGVRCSFYQKKENIKSVPNEIPQPYHCNSYRKHFSVRVGTIMEASKVFLHPWLLLTYMMTASRKGISSCM